MDSDSFLALPTVSDHVAEPANDDRDKASGGDDDTNQRNQARLRITLRGRLSLMKPGEQVDDAHRDGHAKRSDAGRKSPRGSEQERRDQKERQQQVDECHQTEIVGNQRGNLR